VITSEGNIIISVMFIIVTVVVALVSMLTVLRLKKKLQTYAKPQSAYLKLEYEKWLKFKFAGSEPEPEQITNSIKQARKILLQPFLFGYTMLVVGGGTLFISFLVNKNSLHITLLFLSLASIALLNQQYHHYFIKRFQLFEKLTATNINQ